MPKMTSKRRNFSNGIQPSQNANSDDDDPSGVPASQVTATQAEKAFELLSQTQVEQLVNDLVIYLLVADQKKCPIKRQQINKNVLKENSRAFNEIMTRAKTKLQDVFGIKVVDLEQNRYLLVSNLPGTEQDSIEDEEYETTGLIMIVLAVILLENNEVEEEVLLGHLRKIGIDFNCTHPIFGNVHHLITEDFVRQAYVELEKQSTIDQPRVIYRWGARARAELEEQDVMEFINAIYNNDKT